MASFSQPRLFITGATGQLGRLVIQHLLQRAPVGSIIAGVRSPHHESARQFSAQGVAIRIADYSRPDTLVAAFKDADRLLLISSTATPDRPALHRNALEAAKAAGVGLLAYTSMLHADRSSSGLGRDHRLTEALLTASGLPFVLLRHGWYTENHAASVAPALKHGAVIGSAGNGRFSSATRADYAEAAAVVLTGGDPAGRTYELAGDESYTLADLAATIAAASGRSVVYQDMPKEKFRAALIGMGLPEHMAELIAESDVGASKGELEDNSHQLRDLIGRPTSPYRVTIEAAVSNS